MPQDNKQSEEQRKLDEAAQPGGVYVVNGRVVNAEGKELDGWSVDDNGQAVKVGKSTPRTASSTEVQQ